MVMCKEPESYLDLSSNLSLVPQKHREKKENEEEKEE